MKTLSKIIISAVVALAIVVGFLFAQEWKKEQVKPLGSVEVGQAYQSTTTPAVATATNLCPARVGMASSTTGVLGNVNIVTSGGGSLAIYDATTTDATQRDAGQATTSIRLVTFPASATVGSYQFDVKFKRGLLIDYTTTGTGVSSSTISYRCEG